MSQMLRSAWHHVQGSADDSDQEGSGLNAEGAMGLHQVAGGGADGGWKVALGSIELSEEPFPSSTQRSDCSTFL